MNYLKIRINGILCWEEEITLFKKLRNQLCIEQNQLQIQKKNLKEGVEYILDV